MILHLGDSLEVLKQFADNSIDACVTDPPYGLKFMNKHWDYDVPKVELWREVLRVLKPGAHLLSFGGTRTYHRMVVAIEDAGFEVRDQIQWIYGSGFPKSLNLKDEWQGYGTALKPANEPIVLARKPLEKGLTVAENVLKWGCGALNINGSRIRFANEADAKAGRSERSSTSKGFQAYAEGEHDKLDRSDRSHIQGRWPANVLFDEEAATMLDKQSGILKSGSGNKNASNKVNGKTLGNGLGKGNGNGFGGDSGGASRFFYIAKASKKERNAGCEGMKKVSFNHLASDSGGGGGWSKDSNKNPNLPRENHHPTVKPIKLMEYLCKLITPPNGTVLDPFMGSGSTGVAAKTLGYKFIGIEMNAEYLEIATKRIENASQVNE